MADISFDDLPSSGKSSDISFDDIPAEKPAEKPSLTSGTLSGTISGAVKPITRYPSTWARMFQGAKEEMAGGIEKIGAGDMRTWSGEGTVAKGVGQTALGFMSLLGALPGAAIHTTLGEPVSDVTAYETGSKRAGQIAGDVADIGASMVLPVPKGLPRGARAAEPLSIGEIEAAAKAGFESPEIRGTSFRSDAWTQWADETRLYLNNKFIDETGAPRTMAALKRLQGAPAGSTIDGGVLTSFRKALGEAAKSKDDTERYAALKAIHSLDDSITAMPPGSILTGDPQRLAEVWGKARGDWTSAKHAERIDEALETARNKTSSTYSGGNLDNKMRQAIEKILDSKTERRGYTDEELEQMRRVIGRRDSLLTGAPRALSKILGGQGGFPAAIAASAGVAKFGPAGALAPAAGYAMKVLGDSITLSRIDKLDKMIRGRAPASEAAKQAMAAYGQAAQTIRAQPTADNMLRLFVASSLLSDAAHEGGVDLGLHELVHAGSGAAIGKGDSSSPAPSSFEYTSGGKHYRYSGTGDYDDVKNWEVTPVQ